MAICPENGITLIEQVQLFLIGFFEKSRFNLFYEILLCLQLYKIEIVKLDLFHSFSANETGGHTRFCWTESEQGLLKSAFYFGYVLLQVHGGSLSEKFGTKRSIFEIMK